MSLEAFSYQVPLVSTAVFGLAEQIEEGENALVFDIKAPGSLAESIRQIFSEPELAAKLVAGGEMTLRERYSLAGSTSSYFNEFKGVCRRC